MGKVQQSSNASEFIIIKNLEKDVTFLCLSFIPYRLFNKYVKIQFTSAENAFSHVRVHGTPSD